MTCASVTDPVLIQADGLGIHRLPQRVQIEPGALEQAQVLAERNQRDQGNHRQDQNQGFWAGKSTHSGGLGQNRRMKYHARLN